MIVSLCVFVALCLCAFVVNVFRTSASPVVSRTFTTKVLVRSVLREP